MGLDLRSTTERHNSMFNSDPVTLNTEFQVFKSGPQIAHRQEHKEGSKISPAVYHLAAQE